MLERPLVVGLHQDRPDQTDDRRLVGEDAHDVGAALHLPVQALQGVGNRYEDRDAVGPAVIIPIAAYGATIRDRGIGSTKVWAGRYIR